MSSKPATLGKSRTSDVTTCVLKLASGKRWALKGDGGQVRSQVGLSEWRSSLDDLSPGSWSDSLAAKDEREHRRAGEGKSRSVNFASLSAGPLLA